MGIEKEPLQTRLAEAFRLPLEITVAGRRVGSVSFADPANRAAFSHWAENGITDPFMAHLAKTALASSVRGGRAGEMADADAKAVVGQMTRFRTSYMHKMLAVAGIDVDLEHVPALAASMSISLATDAISEIRGTAQGSLGLTDRDVCDNANRLLDMAARRNTGISYFQNVMRNSAGKKDQDFPLDVEAMAGAVARGEVGVSRQTIGIEGHVAGLADLVVRSALDAELPAAVRESVYAQAMAAPYRVGEAAELPPVTIEPYRDPAKTEKVAKRIAAFLDGCSDDERAEVVGKLFEKYGMMTDHLAAISEGLAVGENPLSGLGVGDVPDRTVLEASMRFTASLGMEPRTGLDTAFGGYKAKIDGALDGLAASRTVNAEWDVPDRSVLMAARALREATTYGGVDACQPNLEQSWRREVLREANRQEPLHAPEPSSGYCYGV